MVNKAILIGNLGSDPESNQTKTGITVCNISVATSKKWKDKTTGEQQEKTEWHRVVMFDKLAEVAVKYLTKGAKVYICGEIKTKKWTDKEGIDRYTTEILANEMRVLGSQDGGESSSKPPAPPAESYDDDIPF